MSNTKSPPLDRMIAYENGELDEDSIVELFQELIDSDLCWQLQGSYARMAQRLIDSELCHKGA